MNCVNDFPEFMEMTTCEPEEAADDTDTLQLNVTNETLLQDETDEEEEMTDRLLDEPDMQ